MNRFLAPIGAADCSHGWSDAQRSAGIAEPVVNFPITCLAPEGRRNLSTTDKIMHRASKEDGP